ncbi:MAG: hypothetical protein KDD37_01470 [Bdellovibrionales bacterium]|nr:hypothetical protein [Bdellovibrionales bacterium]
MARYILLLFLVGLTACKNLYDSTADTTSDEAMLFKMERYLNDFLWDDAIDVYGELSIDTQSEREPKTLYVSALMGRCGFEFISFVNSISDDLDSGSNLFPLLLSAMPDATSSKVNDCIVANTQIQEIITDHGAQTSDYNMSVLNGLARMGILVNQSAADASNNLDPAFDPCDSGDMSDANVRQLVSAFARVINDIGSSSLSFLGTSLDGLCDPGDVLEVAGVCDATDASSVTPAQICGMRALMNESSSIGFGTCTGDVATCACAVCP